MPSKNTGNDPHEIFSDILGVPETDSHFINSAQSSGGNNDYYVLNVANPKRLDPYIAECEDLIETMQMTFQEGEAFKAIWRKCMLRLGFGKPDDSELRNAEKVKHFGQRMLAMCEKDLYGQETHD